MVYHMSGGNTDYDPSLGGLPSMTFQEMDGDFSKVFIVDPTRDGGGWFSDGSFHIGRPVIVDGNIPTKLKRGGPNVKRAKLLDVNRITGGLDLVCPKFKDIVEEFEPDIHQFFPMEYYDAKGKEKIGEGYWMIICQRLDTLHDTLCFPPRNEKGFMDFFNEKYGGTGRDLKLDKVVFDRKKIANHHMWHDKFHPSSNLFSDELGSRLIEADFSGLVYRHYQEA